MFIVSYKLTGRAKSNLLRTLKTLERYGIVELHKQNNALVPTLKNKLIQSQ